MTVLERLPGDVTDNTLPRFVPKIPMTGVIFDYSAYAAKVTPDGSTVLELADNGPRGDTMKARNPALAPTLVKIDGRQFIRAGSAEDRLLAGSVVGAAKVIGVVWQAEARPASGFAQAVYAPAVVSVNSSGGTLAAFAGSIVTTTIPVTLNATHVSILQVDGAASVLRHNGVELVVNAGTNTATGAPSLGFKNLPIARFVGLDRLLSQAERAQFEAYLLDLTRGI